MNSWKKLSLIICLLISISSFKAETSSDIKRRMTLSLGYCEDFNSNEGMKHLPLTTIQGYSWVADQFIKMTCGHWSRAGLVVADLVMHMPYLGKDFNANNSNWFLKEKWWPYLPAYHEFGHARAIRAFAGKSFDEYELEVSGERVKIDSVLWYYLYSLKHTGFMDDAQTCFNSSKTRKPTQKVAIYAGGLNNEARLSRELADWVYRFNGHIAYFGPYLRGKVAPISYTAKTLSKVVAENVGDIHHIAKYYKSYFPEFDLDYIQYGGWASLLLSSSTYSFLKGWIDFIQTGDPSVKTLTWNGIRMPDIHLYFTRNGLSLEMVTGYQATPNLWLNLGVETVYYYRLSAMEFTPSVRYVWPTKLYGSFDFDIGLVVNTEMNFSGYMGVEWTDPVNPLTLQAKLIHHNANTYVGERNITYSNKTDHEVEFMVAASLNY